MLRFKAEAFALSAAIAGLAGALYGHFTSYIAPDLFLPLITVYIFLAVTAGGTGRPAGALVGAYLVMTLLEATRFVVELMPAVSAVQRAALKEMLIARGADPRAAAQPARAPARAHSAGAAPATGGRHERRSNSCLAALKQPGPPEALFKAIDQAMAATVGHKLFTLLYVAPDGRRVKRLYTNMPKEYPVGGYKPVTETPWHQQGRRRAPRLGRLRRQGHRMGVLRPRADQVAGLRVGDERAGRLCRAGCSAP